MGYTQFSIDKISPYLSPAIRSVLDLGAQNNYAQPKLPAPYMSEWYKARNILYHSVDINGENGSMALDLSLPQKLEFQYDMVVDCGTSEHVGREGKFNWEAIYNCWVNKHKGLKDGGLMYCENPMTGNWPGHGFNYYTPEFYVQLDELSGYDLIELGTHPACNNTTDGWNVYCMMIKRNYRFPTLENFKKLQINQS